MDKQANQGKLLTATLLNGCRKLIDKATARRRWMNYTDEQKQMSRERSLEHCYRKKAEKEVMP